MQPDGNITVTVTVTPRPVQGSVITHSGTTSGVRQPAQSNPSGSLPFTGSPVALLLMLAAIALAVGFVLVRAGRAVTRRGTTS